MQGVHDIAALPGPSRPHLPLEETPQSLGAVIKFITCSVRMFNFISTVVAVSIFRVKNIANIKKLSLSLNNYFLLYLFHSLLIKDLKKKTHHNIKLY